MLFEVMRDLVVVNGQMETIGWLRPGVEYRAHHVDDEWVTLAGPNDSFGYVDRLQITFKRGGHDDRATGGGPQPRPDWPAADLVGSAADLGETRGRDWSPTAPWSPDGRVVDIATDHMSKRQKQRHLQQLWNDIYGTAHALTGDAGQAVLDAGNALHHPYTGESAYTDIQLHDASINGNLPPDRSPGEAVFSMFYDQSRGAPYFLRYDHLSIEAVIEIAPEFEWRQELSDLSLDTWELRVVARTESIDDAIALFARLEQCAGRAGLGHAAWVSVLGPVDPRHYAVVQDALLDYPHQHWHHMLRPGETLAVPRNFDRPVALAAWGEISITDF